MDISVRELTALLGVLAILASFTKSSVDNRIIQLLTDYVNNGTVITL